MRQFLRCRWLPVLACTGLALAQTSAIELLQQADSLQASNTTSEQLTAAEQFYVKARATASTEKDGHTEASAILGLLQIQRQKVSGEVPASAQVLRQSLEWVTDVRAHGSPSQVQAAINLAGIIHVVSKDYEGGVRLFETLDMSRTELSERFVYYYNRGRTYEKADRPEPAFRDYLKSLELNPAYTTAMDGARRNAKSDAQFARICKAIAAGKGDDTTCFVEAVQRWPGSLEILAAKLERLPIDSFETDMELLGKRQPAWSGPLAELRRGWADLLQKNDPRRVCPTLEPLPKFEAWSNEHHALSVALRTMVDKMAPLRSETASAMQIGKLFSGYLAAWVLDPSDSSTSEKVAQLLQKDWNPPSVECWKGLVQGIAKKTRDPAAADRDEESAREWSRFHISLGEMLKGFRGDIVKRFRSCNSTTDPLDPPTQWNYAIHAEVPGMAKAVEPRRYLADCYLALRTDPKHLQLNGQYEDEINGILAARRFSVKPSGGSGGGGFLLNSTHRDLPAPLVRDHMYSTLYAGAWLKSSAQAGIAMAMDSPQAWGQGAQGFGKRLASSQATRGIRQALALGLDYKFAQRPFYVDSNQHGRLARFRDVVRQTFLSRNERLEWKPAYWRLGSAFGSEAISQAWRPPGIGLGGRNNWSWAARGAFVLVGDTVSNAFREFLPRHGAWGKFIRPLIQP